MTDPTTWPDADADRANALRAPTNEELCAELREDSPYPLPCNCKTCRAAETIESLAAEVAAKTKAGELLYAENERLTDTRDELLQLHGEVIIERDAALAEVAALRQREEGLRKALTYYATAQHLATPDDWDSCSGEHSMWQFPDPTEETMVEGGWIARQALEGATLDFLSADGKLIDDEDAPTAALAATKREG